MKSPIAPCGPRQVPPLSSARPCKVPNPSSSARHWSHIAVPVNLLLSLSLAPRRGGMHPAVLHASTPSPSRGPCEWISPCGQERHTRPALPYRGRGAASLRADGGTNVPPVAGTGGAAWNVAPILRFRGSWLGVGSDGETLPARAGWRDGTTGHGRGARGPMYCTVGAVAGSLPLLLTS